MFVQYVMSQMENTVKIMLTILTTIVQELMQTYISPKPYLQAVHAFMLLMGDVSVYLQMISVLVDKMIRTQIVDCAAVANWIFSPDMAHDFTKYGFMCF